MRIQQNKSSKPTLHQIRFADRMESHKRKLLRFIGRNMSPALKQKLDPIDIYQETMICALKSDENSTPSEYDTYSWLCHIAEQRIIDAHRRFIQSAKRSVNKEVCLDGRCTQSKPGGLIEMLATSMTTPTQAIQKNEYLDTIGELLNGLPEAQRIALEMRYVDGMPIKKIGEQLGLSSGSLRVMLSRTMAKLQESLKEL